MPQTARQTPQASPEPMPNHRDIMSRLAELESRNGMRDLVMQRIETKLDDMRRGFSEGLEKVEIAIGWEKEDERGKPIGTGVVGRLMRLEIRTDGFHAMVERWRWILVGGVAVLAVVVPLVWWLIDERVSPILR